MRKLLFSILFLFLTLPLSSTPFKGTHRASHSTSKSTKTKATKAKVPKSSTVARRNAKGRIARSRAARGAFMKQAGYPKGRKGYVIDHVVPLECGGADTPSNMQWQTKSEGRAKDRTERSCRRE